MIVEPSSRWLAWLLIAHCVIAELFKPSRSPLQVTLWRLSFRVFQQFTG
jgi:hypothetical protein